MKKNRIARKTRKNRMKYVMKGGGNVEVQLPDGHIINFTYDDKAYKVGGEESARGMLTQMYTEWQGKNVNKTPRDFVDWLVTEEGQRELGDVKITFASSSSSSSGAAASTKRDDAAATKRDAAGPPTTPTKNNPPDQGNSGGPSLPLNLNDPNYECKILYEDTKYVLSANNKSITCSELDWEKSEDIIKNKGLRYYLNKVQSSSSAAAEEEVNKSIAVIIENIGDAIHDFLHEGNITYDTILSIKLIVYSYCHLYGYKNEMSLVWLNLAIAVLRDTFPKEDRLVIPKLIEKFGVILSNLTVDKANKDKIKLFLSDDDGTNTIKGLKKKLEELIKKNIETIGEQVFLFTVMFNRINNDRQTNGKHLENKLKEFIYDELLHNRMLINPKSSKASDLEVEAVLKHQSLEQLDFVTAYETGSEDSGDVWRKFMGLGNMKDNSQLILKTIKFPKENVIIPTFDALMKLYEKRGENYEDSELSDDMKKMMKIIETYPEYSLWKITNNLDNDGNKRKAIATYRNLFVRNLDGDHTRDLHSVYFPHQKIYNTTDAGSPSGFEVLRDNLRNELFGRQGRSCEVNSTAQECDEATQKLGILRNNDFHGDQIFPKHYEIADTSGGEGHKVPYNKALDSKLRVRHFFGTDEREGELIVEQEKKNDNRKLTAYTAILTDFIKLYKSLLNKFRTLVYDNRSLYLITENGTNKINIKKLILQKFKFLIEFIKNMEDRAAEEEAAAEKEDAGQENEDAGQENENYRLYVILKRNLNIMNKFISDKKKKKDAKKDDKQKAGVTPENFSNQDDEVAEKNKISFYDTELGSFLAKGMDHFLHPYLQNELPNIEVGNDMDQYLKVQTSPFIAAATWNASSVESKEYANLELVQCLDKRFNDGIKKPTFVKLSGEKKKNKPSKIVTRRKGIHLKQALLREFLETNFTAVFLNVSTDEEDIIDDEMKSNFDRYKDSILFKLLYNLFCFDFELPQSDIPEFKGLRTTGYTDLSHEKLRRKLTQSSTFMELSIDKTIEIISDINKVHGESTITWKAPVDGDGERADNAHPSVSLSQTVMSATQAMREMRQMMIYYLFQYGNGITSDEWKKISKLNFDFLVISSRKNVDDKPSQNLVNNLTKRFLNERPQYEGPHANGMTEELIGAIKACPLISERIKNLVDNAIGKGIPRFVISGLILNHKTQADEMQIHFSKMSKILYYEDNTDTGNPNIHHLYTFDGFCFYKLLRIGAGGLYQKTRGCCVGFYSSIGGEDSFFQRYKSKEKIDPDDGFITLTVNDSTAISTTGDIAEMNKWFIEHLKYQFTTVGSLIKKGMTQLEREFQDDFKKELTMYNRAIDCIYDIFALSPNVPGGLGSSSDTADSDNSNQRDKDQIALINTWSQKWAKIREEGSDADWTAIESEFQNDFCSEANEKVEYTIDDEKDKEKIISNLDALLYVLIQTKKEIEGADEWKQKNISNIFFIDLLIVKIHKILGDDDGNENAMDLDPQGRGEAAAGAAVQATAAVPAEAKAGAKSEAEAEAEAALKEKERIKKFITCIKTVLKHLDINLTKQIRRRSASINSSPARVETGGRSTRLDKSSVPAAYKLYLYIHHRMDKIQEKYRELQLDLQTMEEAYETLKKRNKRPKSQINNDVGNIMEKLASRKSIHSKMMGEKLTTLGQKIILLAQPQPVERLMEFDDEKDLQISFLNEQLEECKREKELCKRKLEECNRKLEECNRKLEECNRKLIKYKSKVARLKERKKKYKKMAQSHEGKDDKIADLNADLTALDTQLRELKAEREALLYQKELLEGEKQLLEQENEKKGEGIKNIENELVSAKDQIEKLTKKISELEKQQHQLLIELSNMRSYYHDISNGLQRRVTSGPGKKRAVPGNVDLLRQRTREERERIGNLGMTEEGRGLNNQLRALTHSRTAPGSSSLLPASATAGATGSSKQGSAAQESGSSEQESGSSEQESESSEQESEADADAGAGAGAKSDNTKKRGRDS